jgi:4'-phosphopantetheinyl transferase
VSLDSLTTGSAIASPVDAWWRSLDDVDEDTCSRLSSFLAPTERQHADRFHRAMDRRRYCVRRGTLRELLALYLGCFAHDVPILHSPLGKPYVEGCDIKFNLSHSRGMALYAFGYGREIGCDVEWRDSRFATQETANLVLSRTEMAVWQELPEPSLTNAFFDYWTCKEAYVKALGIGLAVPPSDITVSLEGSPQFVALPRDDGSQWSLAPVHLRKDYAAVIAMRGSAPPIRIRQFGSA